MDDMPTMQCPNCGHEEEDFDGFGFIGLCQKCGHCNHPNSTLENGKWICGICGQEVTHRAAIQQPIQPDSPDGAQVN